MQKTAPRDFKVYKEADYPQDKKASPDPDWPPQAFHVSHLGEGSFKTDGFRPWALSRDMGMIEATGGMVDVHVNRRAKPYDPAEIAHRHFHNVHYQMVYVLKGWVRSEFEGHGEHLMKEGSCWLQPPRIKHTVLGFSDDLEILEVIIPANYDTVNLNEPPKGTPDPAGGAPHAR